MSYAPEQSFAIGAHMGLDSLNPIGKIAANGHEGRHVKGIDGPEQPFLVKISVGVLYGMAQDNEQNKEPFGVVKPIYAFALGVVSRFCHHFGGFIS